MGYKTQNYRGLSAKPKAADSGPQDCGLIFKNDDGVLAKEARPFGANHVTGDVATHGWPGFVDRLWTGYCGEIHWLTVSRCRGSNAGGVWSSSEEHGWVLPASV